MESIKHRDNHRHDHDKKLEEHRHFKNAILHQREKSLEVSMRENITAVLHVTLDRHRGRLGHRSVDTKTIDTCLVWNDVMLSRNLRRVSLYDEMKDG
jgi:hypothetical protein